MASRTPPIPMANPFEGSFEVQVGAVLQYLAVRRGTSDEGVQPLPSAASAVSDGIEIEGVAQRDGNLGEWIGVRYFGTTWAIAAEAITRDDPLEAVSTVAAATNGRMGRILPAAILAPPKMIAGIALENANTNTIFKMFLTRHVQVNG